MLYDNPEGQDGVGGVRQVHEAGDVCIPTAHSCGYMVETNTVL